MKRLLLLVVAVLIAFPVAADAQKQCVKGKPCGNTCIAVKKTCRVETPSHTPRPSCPPPAATASRAEPDESVPWVASSRGQVYYRRECSNANRLAPANRIYFRTEEEARRASYRRSTSRGC
jgi:hypothetical protein